MIHIVTGKMNSGKSTKLGSIYNQLDANSFVLPSFDCFNLALDGFHLLKEKGLVQKNILTVIDFSLSSNMKRLWVIDLEKNSILWGVYRLSIK